MPAREELGAHVGKVVYLAIEDDLHGAVFVGQRLIAGRQVDDAQAPVTEANARPVVVAGRVRPAVNDGIGHRDEYVAIDRLQSVVVEASGDAAHVRFPPPSVRAPGPACDREALRYTNPGTTTPCARRS